MTRPPDPGTPPPTIGSRTPTRATTRTCFCSRGCWRSWATSGVGACSISDAVKGAYSRELARRGARVTGVDGSGTLIAAARKRAAAAGLDIDHQQANASALDRFASGSFDLIVASMVLMNVEDYAGAIREAYRVLAPGGAIAHEHHPPLFLRAGLGLGRRQGPAGTPFRGRSLLRAHRLARSHRLDIPDADAAPTSPARGLHDRRDRSGIHASRVSRTDDDGGGAEGVAALRAHDARAVLSVHAVAEDVRAGAVRKAAALRDRAMAAMPARPARDALRTQTSARCRRCRSSPCRRARARRRESDR